jgi:hypothetical protein
VAGTPRGLLPLARRPGITTATVVDIETLADQLRADTSAAGGVVKTPDLIGAWTRLA